MQKHIWALTYVGASGCISARTSLEVSADCMRESCADRPSVSLCISDSNWHTPDNNPDQVVMGMPSLLLLPVLDALVCQMCLGFVVLRMDAWRILFNCLGSQIRRLAEDVDCAAGWASSSSVQREC